INSIDTVRGLVDALDQMSFHVARYLLEQEEGEPLFGGLPLILYFADGYYPTTPILEFLIDENINREWYPQAFLQCVRHGDLPSVILFHRKGIDIHVKDQEGRNALWYARDPATAEWLILHGVDVSDPVTCEQLALNMTVLILFEKWGIPINLSRPQLNRSLKRAARLGNARMVAYLIEKGADVNSFERPPKGSYWYFHDEDLFDYDTPLILNAWQGYEACTQDMRQQVSPDVAKLLIRAGADVNQEDKDGNTALDHALGEAGCRCRLLAVPVGNRSDRDRGAHADPSAYPGQNHSSIAIELVKAGADVNRINKQGYSPLMLALENFYPEVIPVLLEYGADVNYRNKQGKTPLQIAYRHGLEEAARLLIEAGANPEIKHQ
ncbi:MAG: ankyrin repeat domain-containing protein, partial [Tannerellaceae bacterium]|nr:ankyrin repeat domain-containing protein [Tannerellaceae bacterium]